MKNSTKILSKTAQKSICFIKRQVIREKRKVDFRAYFEKNLTKSQNQSGRSIFKTSATAFLYVFLSEKNIIKTLRVFLTSSLLLRTFYLKNPPYLTQ